MIEILIIGVNNVNNFESNKLIISILVVLYLLVIVFDGIIVIIYLIKNVVEVYLNCVEFYLYCCIILDLDIENMVLFRNIII